jgi:hypothetical protein
MTTQGKLMKRLANETLLFTRDLSKEEQKVMKTLIEDNMAQTFCKGQGHPRQYELTKQGKMILKWTQLEE